MTTEQDPTEKAIEDLTVDLLGREDARIVAAQLLVVAATVFSLCRGAGIIDETTIARLFNESSSAALTAGSDDIKMTVVPLAPTSELKH